MRRRFNGKGPWLFFEQAENAERAERINTWLDEGRRVFGDDGPDAPGKEYEIEEALEPHGNGISVLTKCGKTVKIYSMDASNAVQNRPQHTG